ncbi:uncharacterized protein LOC143303036 [Bombus vancouverensis nearcticus]|uniref:uncharacterized protein LOC143303036 n=1 Tax=Bombus vancouverensis nearcticus TaxID=2705178 RepID=UPI00402BDBD2
MWISFTLKKKKKKDGILNISEVNALTSKQFEWLFRNVVEHYPDIAQYVAHMRSFASVKNTKRYFYGYLDNLDTSESHSEQS